jgi:hypothetical protein
MYVCMDLEIKFDECTRMWSCCTRKKVVVRHITAELLLPYLGNSLELGTKPPEAGSLKIELKRSFKFELSLVVQLLKHFYTFGKQASLGRAAIELT